MLERCVRLLVELKRRRVFRAMAVYAVGAWVAIQVADTTFPYLGLPEWLVTAVIVLAIAGAPTVVALAWIFDLTSIGIQRTPARTWPAPGPAARIGSRHRFAMAAGTTVLALGGGLLWLRAFAPPPARADVVAVLPFTMRVSPELAYLREGIVDLLGRNLEGVTGLRVADPYMVVSMVAAEAADQPLDPEHASRIASRLGAALFILGDVTELEGNVVVTASLYESAVASPRTATVRGETRELFTLLDQLTADLLAQRFGAVSAELTRAAARTTSSPQALRLYLRAEQALRAAQYDSAIAGFQRAVAEDSAFALAYYRLAVAATLNGTHRLASVALENALRHEDRLGQRDRRRLDAFADFRAGRADRAESAYQAILQDHPDDLEARVHLGELLTRYNPLRGRPAADALPHLLKIGELDPAFLCSICTAVNLVLHQGEVERADSLMYTHYPSEPLLAWEAGTAAARADTAGMARWLERISSTPGVPHSLIWQASWVAAFFRHYPLAERLAAAAMRSPAPVRQRTVAQAELVDLAAAQLQWQRAQTELQRLAALAPERALLRRAYLALLPFSDLPVEEVRAVRNSLSGWRASAAGTSLEPLADLLPALRHYLIALASVRLGDHAHARAQADSVRRRDVLHAGSVLRDLALAVEAEIELHAGRPAAALALLDSVRAEVPMELIDFTGTGPRRLEPADIFMLDHARFLRVRALLQLRRNDDALRWIENGFFRMGGNPVYAPAVELLAAEAHEAAGSFGRSREHYLRYLGIVGDADPDLRATVARAEAHLARLSSRTE